MHVLFISWPIDSNQLHSIFCLNMEYVSWGFPVTFYKTVFILIDKYVANTSIKF